MHKKKYLVVCCVDVILWWYTSGGGTYDFMRVHNENFEQTHYRVHTSNCVNANG